MLFKDGDTIVFAGDSTTDADKLSTGDRLGMGYVRLLNGMLNAFCPEVRSRVVNAGVSGNTSADLLTRWEQDVTAEKPDLVFCLIGINDVWRHFDCFDPSRRQISAEEYERNLEAICERAKGARELCLMTPFYMEGNRSDEMRIMTEQYAAVMKGVAKRRGARFIDLQRDFDVYMQSRPGQSITWDRVHPGEIGSLLIARAVWRELQK